MTSEPPAQMVPNPLVKPEVNQSEAELSPKELSACLAWARERIDQLTLPQYKEAIALMRQKREFAMAKRAEPKVKVIRVPKARTKTKAVKPDTKALDQFLLDLDAN